MLAKVFRLEIGTVQRALDLFQSLEMIEVFDNATFAEIMQQDVDKRYDFANGHSAYWLLNKTEDKQNVYYVTSAGYITYVEPNTEYIGIRPMIRIKK